VYQNLLIVAVLCLKTYSYGKKSLNINPQLFSDGRAEGKNIAYEHTNSDLETQNIKNNFDLTLAL